MKGDLGWTTPKGVIWVRDLAGLPSASVPLRALSEISAETWGRFEEVAVDRPKARHDQPKEVGKDSRE